MEFGLREVLIGVGFIVIAGILFDGYRRMRRSRMGELGLPSEMGGSCEEGDNYYSGELPNGGARRLNQSAEEGTQEFDGRVEPGFGEDVLEPAIYAGPEVGNAYAEGESAQLVAERQEEAPEEMAPLKNVSYKAEPKEAMIATDADRGHVGAGSSFDDDGIGNVRRYVMGDSEKPSEGLSALKIDQSDLFGDDEMLLSTRAAQEAKLASHYRGDSRGHEKPSTKSKRSTSKSKPKTKTSREVVQPDDELSIQVSGLEEVIVLNLMAKAGEVFGGVELEKALLSCGFRFGDMDIYHRYEQHVGRGPLLFSIANVMEPGTFDPENLEAFTTPGVCMFMKLPGPKRTVHSFELMVECGRKIVTLLGGELKDEHHSVMTQQTIEHYRQRVLDFDRKLLSHRVTQRT